MSIQSRNAASKPTCNLVVMLGAGFVKLKELQFRKSRMGNRPCRPFVKVTTTVEVVTGSKGKELQKNKRFGGAFAGLYSGLGSATPLAWLGQLS